jgi:hypothetical protein
MSSPTKAPAFTMPPIAVGDVVLWRHNVGSALPAPALVTGTGQFGVSVVMFPPDQKVGTVRDGVRHSSDPANRVVISSDTGVWDYTETHKLLLALRDLAAVQQGAKPAK